MGWVANATPRPLYPGKDPVPVVYEDGWVPGPVWPDAENLTSTGIRFPDRPASSELLYRLSYPGPYTFQDIAVMNILVIMFHLWTPLFPHLMLTLPSRWHSAIPDNNEDQNSDLTATSDNADIPPCFICYHVRLSILYDVSSDWRILIKLGTNTGSL